MHSFYGNLSHNWRNPYPLEELIQGHIVCEPPPIGEQSGMHLLRKYNIVCAWESSSCGCQELYPGRSLDEGAPKAWSTPSGPSLFYPYSFLSHSPNFLQLFSCGFLLGLTTQDAEHPSKARIRKRPGVSPLSCLPQQYARLGWWCLLQNQFHWRPMCQDSRNPAFSFFSFTAWKLHWLWLLALLDLLHPFHLFTMFHVFSLLVPNILRLFMWE